MPETVAQWPGSFARRGSLEGACRRPVGRVL